MKRFTVLIFFSVINLCLYGQTVDFAYTDGNQNSYNIDDVAQITFTGEVLNLEVQDGTVYSWDISTIQNFTYGTGSTSVEEALTGLNRLDVQIYPNPSRGQVQVSYDLPNDDEIEVSVFTLKGSLVLAVFSGNQPSGSHLLNVDAGKLASGAYICRVTGKGFAVSQRLIIEN
jgi:hypothetical protein